MERAQNCAWAGAQTGRREALRREPAALTELPGARCQQGRPRAAALTAAQAEWAVASRSASARLSALRWASALARRQGGSLAAAPRRACAAWVVRCRLRFASGAARCVPGGRPAAGRSAEGLPPQVRAARPRWVSVQVARPRCARAVRPRFRSRRPARRCPARRPSRCRSRRLTAAWKAMSAAARSLLGEAVSTTRVPGRFRAPIPPYSRPLLGLTHCKWGQGLALAAEESRAALIFSRRCNQPKFGREMLKLRAAPR